MVATAVSAMIRASECFNMPPGKMNCNKDTTFRATLAIAFLVLLSHHDIAYPARRMLQVAVVRDLCFQWPKDTGMAKMKSQNETLDVGKIFQLAEQYSVASNRLVKQSWGDKWSCGAPYLLVDSFAVELYLKCLFTQDTGNCASRSHNLRNLFESLTSNTNSQIRDAFKRIIEADIILKHLSAINPGAVKVLDFDRSLDAACETFNKRRYA